MSTIGPGRLYVVRPCPGEVGRICIDVVLHMRHGVDMVAPDRPAELSLANWDLGGAVSQWSYRNADRLFTTEQLIPATIVDDTNDHPTDNSAPAELVEDLSSGCVAAITIVAGGQVAYRWPDQPAKHHLLMSVSKIFTSLAIGILAHQDKLDYANPIRDYLPELGSQWQPCLVQHVLDMASGVDCPEVGDPGAYSDPSHPFYQFEASLGWRPAGRLLSPYELVLSYRRTGRPGSRYEYTSINTFLLAWIIERVTGLRYPEALQQLIWDKLALAHPSTICVSEDGAAVAHGGLIMSADDLARFGTLFTPSQLPEPHALRIPESYLAMLRAQRRSLEGSGFLPPGTGPKGQWNVVDSDGDLYKSGFGGQGLYISPVNDVVIAFCGIPDQQGQTHRVADKCRDLVARFAMRG